MRVLISILWGLFCACSWTWVIGMYLPRIMVDRFGWWGFVAFAIPNVIGCTAFGYFVKNRSRSEAMVTSHSTPMLWFSSVTVAFHAFFVPLLFALLLPDAGEIAPLLTAAVMIALGVVFSYLSNRDWLALAVVVYGISIATFASIGIEPMRDLPWTGRWDSIVLIALIPFILFGFLLCPYLDLTFHRAIQHSPSKHAFAVFGATFSIMIVLSVAIWFASENPAQHPWMSLVLAHILAQSVFTVGAHLREIRLSPAIQESSRRWTVMLLPLVAAAMLPIARFISDSPALEESLYLGFLGLFGTMFPAWFALLVIRSCPR